MTLQPVVLVIDDDADMRHIAQLVLGQVDPDERFLHRTASHGMDGVVAAEAVAAEGRPLLVLCDYRMPGMDGVAVAQALAPLRDRVPMRFYLLSSLGALPDSAGATQARGVDGVLEKGFKPREWRESFRSVLDDWAAAVLP